MFEKIVEKIFKEDGATRVGTLLKMLFSQMDKNGHKVKHYYNK